MITIVMIKIKMIMMMIMTMIKMMIMVTIITTIILYCSVNKKYVTFAFYRNLFCFDNMNKTILFTVYDKDE